MRVLVGLVCALVLSTAGFVRAEALNPKQVAADAKWVAHLDVDTMRASVVVDKAYQECEPVVKAFGAKIDELKAIGQVIDPMKDLKGITVYGTDLQNPEAVAIVQANLSESALGTLQQSVQQLPGYASSTHGAYELHTWVHKCPMGEKKLTATYVQPDILVFGSSVQAVEKALDVLGDAKLSIDGKSALAAKPLAGALLVVRVAGLGSVEKLPVKSPIIAAADVIGLTLGENNNEAYLSADLSAKDTKAAEELKTNIESSLTSALLAVDDSDVADLINAVQVTSNDKTVTVDVRGPADVGWNYLKKLAAKVGEAAKAKLQPQK